MSKQAIADAAVQSLRIMVAVIDDGRLQISDSGVLTRLLEGAKCCSREC